VAGLKKPVSREFKWDNALTPTATEQLEEGIADPGLILERLLTELNMKRL
jgi:hypothetical protein